MRKLGGHVLVTIFRFPLPKCGKIARKSIFWQRFSIFRYQNMATGKIGKKTQVRTRRTKHSGFLLEQEANNYEIIYVFLWCAILALTVVGVGTVFAQIMLVEQSLLHSSCGRIKSHCVIIHECDFFHDDRIMYCVERICSPCERSV